jgi:hypothetical protein
MSGQGGPSGDPFFDLPQNSEWNACIGAQGSEGNYVDGYMEAAVALASAILEKRLYSQRDTLVMPILYNARHAVELALKLSIRRLHQAGIIHQPRQRDHDIAADYALLKASKLGDEGLRVCIEALEPYVISLAAIDDDGQMLRYAETQDGQKSLADRSLANIAVIHASLTKLNKILADMSWRTIEFLDDRETATYTADCSRRDLFEITKMLPLRCNWNLPAFDDAKAKVKARYSIGSNKFADAIEIIQKHREMGTSLGLKFHLAHLTDDSLLLVADEWSKLHPPRQRASAIDYYEYSDRRNFEELKIDFDADRAANEAVRVALVPDEIADLQAIYYLGRDKQPTEIYEREVEATRRVHRLKEPVHTVAHLLEKTNLLTELAKGVARLGRADLAEIIRQKRPDLFD